MPHKLEKKQTAKGRRGNNEGSIYQRSDGRWCAQVVTGYKENGSPIRKYVYAPTRAEVARKAAQMTSNVFESGYLDSAVSTSIMVADMARSWLMDSKKYTVTARTFEWYLNITNTHIVPALGKYRAIDIQTLHLQRLLNGLLDKGKSVRTVKSVKFVLGQLFTYAIDVLKVTANNPADKTKIQRAERKSRDGEMKAIPIGSRSQILQAAESEPLIKPIIVTLMFSGLRSGELIALKWKHIDFNAQTITVDGAATVDSEYDNEGKRLSTTNVVSSTKTASGFRTIRVSACIMDVLREWRERQAVDEIIDKRELTAPDCFVFSTRTGDMRTYAGFRSLLRRFLDKNGMSGIHAHSFRHTFATLLLENNVNPRVVQLYLGHSDVRTTLNIYSSVASEVFDKAARRIDDVYSAIAAGTYEPLTPTAMV
ncbi:site-specific integrase [Clostridia bacterium]|nr:site-specific integrase [Clostridia bacterium]